MDRNQLIDAFLAHFNEDLSDLRQKLADKQLQQAGTRISRMKKDVSDSSSFLPAYNSKIVQSSLQSAEKEYALLLQACQPVKKFSFARNLKQGSQTTTSLPVAGDVVDFASAVTDDQMLHSSRCISNQADEDVVVERKDLQGQSYIVKQLRNCRIELRGPADTVLLKQLHACTVTCAPCRTRYGCLLTV